MTDSERLHVNNLLDRSSGMSLEEYSRRYPHAVMIAMGDVAQNYDGFDTEVATSLDILDLSKSTRRFDLNARVFEVEKRSGVNPYSQMIILGRTPNSDIRLQNTDVSKMHAYLTWKESPEGEIYQIADSDSRNGTWINEKKLIPSKPHTIESGEVIVLGGSVFLCFYYPKELFSILSNMREQS